MFTDIAGSAKRNESMPGATPAERGESFRLQFHEPHDQVIKECVCARGGHVAGDRGDGFLLVFVSADNAVLCAFDIHRRLAEGVPGLQIRIGLNTGEGKPVNGKYYDAAANKASRVLDRAKPGQVYLSGETRALVDRKIRGLITDTAGQHLLKDIGTEELFVAFLDESPPAPPAAPPRNIPFQSLGDLFKGRNVFLKELRDALHSGTRAAISAAPAVTATHGLGGIGKTRLAVEYALRHAADYQALLFVTGETREKLETTFAALTGELILDLPERKQPDPAAQKAGVIKWLRAHPRYLLIIDNVDDKEALIATRDLIKQLPGGHIILTGRISAWPNNVKPLKLPILNIKDATDYLRFATSNRVPARDDDVQFSAIAEKLDGLALALEQAAAYINAQQIPLARYLDIWQRQHDQVLEWFDEALTDYPRNVVTTWQTSFDRLAPAGRRLLDLLCWFAPDPIPDSIFNEEATVKLNAAHSPVIDQAALADLFRYNLATRETALPLFTIHRLVQDVTRRRLEKEGRASTVQRMAVEWMAELFDGKVREVSQWPRFDPLAAHARVLADSAASLNLPEVAGRIYGALENWTFSHGRYDSAVELARLAITNLQQAFGPEHPKTLTGHNMLANALQKQGKSAEAEAKHRDVLAVRARVLGPEHPDTLKSRQNLAISLIDQGQHTEAEAEHRAVLGIFQRLRRPEDPDVLSSRNNLAFALQAQGKHAEAETEHRAVVELRQRVLGPEHPDTLMSRNNLANALRDQGKHAQAEIEHRAVLEIRQRVLGSDHPDVFQSCFNLALCLSAQSKTAEALALAQRAFEGRRKTLGESHALTERAQKLVRQLEQTP
jgi:class 3 adenylate cyclase/tetratricopeptide (TPR) repeat protein